MFSAGATLCLRCGDFAEPTALAVPGVAVCAQCLAGGRPEPLQTREALLPDGGARKRRARTGAVIGGSIGLALGALNLVDHTREIASAPVAIFADTLAFGLFAAAFVGTLGFAIGWVFWPPSAVHRLRPFVARHLGLEDAGDGPPLALLVVPGGLWRRRTEFGLVIASDHGIVFLGVEGTRRAVRAAELARAPALVPSLVNEDGECLELALRHRTSVFLELYAPPPPPGRREAKAELLERLSAGFASAVRASQPASPPGDAA